MLNRFARTMTRLLALSLFLIAVSTLAAHVARADPVTTSIQGDTTGGPLFNRPGALVENQQDPAAFTPTVLSGFEVHYNLVSFTVSAGGSYKFSHLSAFNNYLLLYRDSFDPAAPLTNVLLARDYYDDDKSAFSAALSPGVTYFAIITGSRPGDFGAYTFEIEGLAGVNISQPVSVPEPATLTLLATGLSGVGAALRKRRRRGRKAQTVDRFGEAAGAGSTPR